MEQLIFFNFQGISKEFHIAEFKKIVEYLNPLAEVTQAIGGNFKDHFIPLGSKTDEVRSLLLILSEFITGPSRNYNKSHGIA